MAGKSTIIGKILDSAGDVGKKFFTRAGRAEASLVRQERNLKKARDIVEAFEKNPRVSEALKNVDEYRRFWSEDAGKMVNKEEGLGSLWSKPVPRQPSVGDEMLASRLSEARENAKKLEVKVEKQKSVVDDLHSESVKLRDSKKVSGDIGGRKEAKRIIAEVEGGGTAHKVASWSFDKVLYPWKHWSEHPIRNTLSAATELAAATAIVSKGVDSYSASKRDSENNEKVAQTKSYMNKEWGAVTKDSAVAGAMSNTSLLRSHLRAIRDTMYRQYQVDKDWTNARESAKSAIELVKGSDTWNRAIREGVDSSLIDVSLGDLENYENIYYEKFPDEESQVLGENFWIGK